MTQKALLQSAGDGTTVPAGYVGEVLSANTGPLTGLGVNPVSIGSAITLNVGWYLIIIAGNQETVAPTVTNISLTDGSNSIISNDSTGALIPFQVINTSSAGVSIKTNCIMRVTTNGTQYKPRFGTTSAAGSQHVLSIQAIRLS